MPLQVFQRFDTTAGRGSACLVSVLPGRRRACWSGAPGRVRRAGRVQRRCL